jgi:thiocyanate hydrolase subunit beta
MFSREVGTSSKLRDPLGNVSRERVVDHRTEPGGGHLSSSEGFDEIEYRVGNLAPVLRTPLDSPYEISNELFAALRHVLHDVGGQPDLPQPYREKVEEEWEMNAYVTCECLGWRGVWNSEERRRAENDLGATLYFGLPYYARWATVAAKVLINTGQITPDELSAKIDEVRARLEKKSA